MGIDDLGRQLCQAEGVLRENTRYTFTEPQVLVDWSENAHGTKFAVMDTTMIEHEGTFYRFTKNEGNRNTNASNVNYHPTGKRVGMDKTDKLLDRYGSGGYYPFITTDLESGVHLPCCSRVRSRCLRPAAQTRDTAVS